MRPRRDAQRVRRGVQAQADGVGPGTGPRVGQGVEHAREVVARAAADVHDEGASRAAVGRALPQVRDGFGGQVRDGAAHRRVPARGQEVAAGPGHGAVVAAGGTCAGQQAGVPVPGHVEAVPLRAA
nr:hypothetical protein GCM10025730_14550 [Promicromonospora thailandica]